MTDHRCMLYYRNGYFQVTRNTEANSYRLRWYPGMVSATQAPFFVAPLLVYEPGRLVGIQRKD